MIAESGFITHKLITSYPSSSVENDATDDSVFWSHFSEGSLMTQLQLGISVMITSGAVAAGQMPGVEMSEEGRKAVGQYGKVLMVCFHPSPMPMREMANA
jgi:glutathione S-transferase